MSWMVDMLVFGIMVGVFYMFMIKKVYVLIILVFFKGKI